MLLSGGRAGWDAGGGDWRLHAAVGGLEVKVNAATMYHLFKRWRQGMGRAGVWRRHLLTGGGGGVVAAGAHFRTTIIISGTAGHLLPRDNIWVAQAIFEHYSRTFFAASIWSYSRRAGSQWDYIWVASATFGYPRLYLNVIPHAIFLQRTSFAANI